MAGPEVAPDAAEEWFEVWVGAGRPAAPAGGRRCRRRATGRLPAKNMRKKSLKPASSIGVPVELEADPPGEAAAPPKPWKGFTRRPRPGPLVGLPVRAELVIRLRFLGSERTSLASLTSLKRCSAPVSPLLTSGWCSRASRRKAFRMSAWLAVRGTPSVA